MLTRIKNKEREWFMHKVQLKSCKGNKRGKQRLYEHGNEFWLVEVVADEIHVYSLDKRWFGWFTLGVTVNPLRVRDETLIGMVRNETAAAA